MKTGHKNYYLFSKFLNNKNKKINLILLFVFFSLNQKLRKQEQIVNDLLYESIKDFDQKNYKKVYLFKKFILF